MRGLDLRVWLTTLGFAATLSACAGGSSDSPDASRTKSLTGKGYAGKKYYMGWGHAGDGDPQNMHNEVKYDVIHTHDIFTKALGGGYASTKLVDAGVSTQSVESSFATLKGSITKDDMYVQYSSGHGSQQGLMTGGSYEQIATRVLSLPAKEIIVFTMACHSGGLIDTFNSKKSSWQNFATEGRTFFAMSSSTVQQQSSTGPGTSDGAAGPGSAGSAYGHALWKALAGDSDGEIDGVKDGFIELGEIEAFTKRKTKELGGHDPVSTGSYHPALVMNRVPKAGEKSAYSYPERGTNGWSQDEIKKAIQSEDGLQVQLQGD